MAKTSSVGIIANPHKERAEEGILQLMEAFKSVGVRVILESATAALIGKGKEGHPIREIAPKVEIMLVLGGDGTMLDTAHRLAGLDTPLLGVNIGTLGFLTCTTCDRASELAQAINDRQYQVSARARISIEMLSADGKREKFLALNEVTVSRGTISRLVHLEARINGEFLNNYSADGLIVATPTGSTAYSLAAGGPIISPGSNVFVMTPICAHALSNRSIVFSDQEVIEILPRRHRDEIVVTVDGHTARELAPDARLKIERSEHDVALVTFPGHSFYETLQKKLRWSGSSI